MQKVSQQLGLKDGILAAYNQNAATHHVYADIQGVKASDRSPISGKFFILGTAGSEFVVTDGKGVYKTNEQIITSKLTTEVGEAATTQVRTITFNDESAIASLQQLQSAYPNAPHPAVSRLKCLSPNQATSRLRNGTELRRDNSLLTVLGKERA